MLTDWYFCNCINASPQATFALLGILESLTADDDLRLRRIALDELRKTDLWSQIYSLRTVLSTARNSAHLDDFTQMAKSFFHEVCGAVLPEPMELQGARLVEQLFLESSGGAELVEELEAVSESCLSWTSEFTPPAPYIDLKEHFGPTLVLLVAMELASGSPEEQAGIAKLLDREESSTRLLFEEAIEHRFGRMAMIFAVRLASSISLEGLGSESLIARVWSDPFCSVHAEPDLMELTAELVFLGSESEAGRGSGRLNVHSALAELVNLKRYRSFFSRDYERASRVASTATGGPVSRLAGQRNRDLEKQVSLVYWQSALLKLCAEDDPVSTLAFLNQAWVPPRSARDGVFVVDCAIRGEELKEWEGQLSALGALQDVSFKLNYKAGAWEGPKKFKWAILSPWIPFKNPNDETVGDQAELTSFARVTHHAALLRLCSSLSIATSLIRSSLVASDKHEKPNLAVPSALIAHIHEVLNAYKNWLRDYRQPAGHRIPSLPSSLSGLASFTWRQTNLIGKATFPEIHPELFTDLLDCGSISNPERGLDVHLPWQERQFLGERLPLLLFDLILEGYVGATGSEGPGRWLRPDLIEKIYKAGENRKGVNPEALPNLVMRFLCPPERRIVKHYHWHINNPNEWRVNARRLLLTLPDLSVRQWEAATWREPAEDEWVAVGQRGYQNSVRLVRAIERVSSLRARDTEDYDLLARQWRDELFFLLSGIAESAELDRLVRLRLLELLDEEPLSGDLELQELISFLILEFGGGFDLKQLVDRVFFRSNGLTTTAARRELRTVLVVALTEKHEAERLSAPAARSLSDPRVVLGDNQKGDLIEEGLSNLVFSYQANDQLEAEELFSLIASAKRGAFERLATAARFRHTMANLEMVDKRQLLAPAAGSELPPSWAVQSIVANPNSAEARLVYSHLETRGLENLFETPNAGRLWELNEVYYVLARLVEKQWTADGVRAVFDYGKSIRLKIDVSETEADGLKVLDFFGIPVKKVKSPDGKVMDVAARQPVRYLVPKYEAGDLRRVEIGEDAGGSGSVKRRLSIRFSDDLESQVPSRSLLAWDADISRRFQSLAAVWTDSTYARLNEAGEWSPVPLNLVDLLIKQSQEKSDSSPLAFAGLAVGRFGRRMWRFSCGPGRVFEISPDTFEPESAERIEDTLDSLSGDDALGLLISVRPFVDELGRVKLRLDANVSASGNPLYPSLAKPFDFRNIEWRKVFDEQEVFPAEKTGTRWFYRRPAETAKGFPVRVPVEWDKYRPQADSSGPEEFRVINWASTFLRGMVRGNKTFQPALKGKLSDIVPKLVDIREGDRFQLEEVIGRVMPASKGNVDVLSKEGFRLSVPLESLSMRPFTIKEVPDIDKGRQLQVTRVILQDEVELAISDQAVFSLPEDDGEFVGVVLRVPGAGGKQITVGWQTSSGVTGPDGFTVENINDVKWLRPGVRIVYKKDWNGIRLSVVNLIVRATALWKVASPGDVGERLDSADYVGSSEYQGRRLEVREVRPGAVLLKDLTRGGITRPDPFSIQGDARAAGYSVPGGGQRRVEVFGEAGGNAPRTVLVSRNLMLSGGKTRDRYFGGVEIARTNIRMTALDDGWFRLERYFELRRARSEGQYVRSESQSEKTAEHRKALNDYLESPEKLGGYFVAGTGGGRFNLSPLGALSHVPIDTGWEKWTSFAAVGKDEGTFIADARYPESAEAVVYDMPDGAVFASFRMVPSRDVDEFLEMLRLRPTVDTELEFSLYYVGGETIPDLVNTDEDELYHRFEFGYGATVLVPESRLLFNNQPFSTASHVVFHGDLITGVSVSEDKLNILSIRPSQGHVLFKQRQRHKIVHLVHAGVRDGQTAIESVEYFSEDRLQGTTGVFDKISAAVSEESLSHLSRLAERDPDGKVTFLGRLSESDFIESFGAKILFKHVSMTMREEGAPVSPLRSRERIFVRAGEIRRTDNDVRLVLYPHERLDERDVGKDFIDGNSSRVTVGRRQFSVREDLLGRLGESSDSLENKLLLVQIFADSSDRLRADVISGAPARREGVLSGVISLSGPTLAAVVRIDKNGTELTVELHPGIFVTISAQSVGNLPVGLEKGSIVRILSADETRPSGKRKFKLLEASPSQKRYFKDGPRPVVVLPMNNLFSTAGLLKQSWTADPNEDASQLLHGADFSIGDFPNIVGEAAGFIAKSGKWVKPSAEKMLGLMRQDHPKIAIAEHVSSVSKIAPIMGQWPVGRLKLCKNDGRVLFESLSDVPVNEHPLDWRFLSFRDSSARTIEQVVMSSSWWYHDVVTVTFSQELAPKKGALSAHTVETGPLFFVKNRDGRLALRYPKDRFLQMGLSISAVVASLKHKALKKEFAVAGSSEFPGLWVEVAPGRIAELPETLMFAVSSEMKVPLRRMHWSAFSPGDLVTLRRADSGETQIDQIDLLEWRPGPRGLLGQRAVLPVLSRDAQSGGVTLGAGLTKLTIPVVAPNSDAAFVVLDHENNIEDFDPQKMLPQKGDVILLESNSQSGFGAVGFDGMSVRPVARWNEAGDDVEQWLRDRFDGQMLPERLSALIALSGGALAVTFERYERDTNRIIFSRRKQIPPPMPPESVALCRVIGMIDQGRVLLRCGSSFLIVDASAVVSGLPNSVRDIVIGRLATRGHEIWIYRNENGEVQAGIKREERDEFNGVAVDFLFEDHDIAEPGFLFRSADSYRLYWLPRAEAAWTKLPSDMLGRAKLNKKFRVRRIRPKDPNSGVSSVRVRECQSEYKGLRLGAELVVEVIGEIGVSDGRRGYAAETIRSRNLLRLECEPAENLKPGEIMTAEVLVKNSGWRKNLVAVPFGRRPFRIELPDWVNKLPEPGLYRDELTRFLGLWRGTPVDLPKTEPEWHLASDEEIQNVLCWSYKNAPASFYEFNLGAQAAREWQYRAMRSPHIFLPYALIAASVLDNAGLHAPAFADGREIDHGVRSGWRTLGAKMLNWVSAGAVRSLYVEVLSREWFFHASRRMEHSAGLRARLDRLSGIVRTEVDTRSISRIEGFCKAVSLRPRRHELRPVSNSLLAAIGIAEGASELFSGDFGARILVDLLNLYWPTLTSMGEEVLWINYDQKNQIKKLISKIVENELDCSVLSPLFYQQKPEGRETYI